MNASSPRKRSRFVNQLSPIFSSTSSRKPGLTLPGADAASCGNQSESDGHNTSTNTVVFCLSSKLAELTSLGWTPVTLHVDNGAEVSPLNWLR